MSCNAAQGAQSKFAIATSGTIDGSSTMVDFVRESVEQVQTYINSDGIRSTRSLSSNRVRDRVTVVQGSLWLHPSPKDLDLLLPLILGGAKAGNVVPLEETLPTFAIGKDLDGKAYEYKNCVVNRAVFQSQAAGLLELRIDILGTHQEDLTFPSLSLGETLSDQPYVHSDAKDELKLDTKTIEMMNWRCTLDNAIEQRFVNSLTATSLCPTTRRVQVEFTTPFKSADEISLYTKGTSAIVGVVKFTNQTLSVQFDWPAMHLEARTPKVAGKREIAQYLQYGAFATQANNEMAVTNISS